MQPVVGSISLLGLTTKEATQQLTARLSGIFAIGAGAGKRYNENALKGMGI